MRQETPVILIVTTLQREAQGLERVVQEAQGASRPKLAVLGVTGQRAAGAAAALLERERPDALVSLGFAGALDDTLVEGDLILGSRVVFRDKEENYSSWLPSDDALLQRAREALDERDVPYRVGDVITAWKEIGHPSEKGQWGATTGGLVVDMEGSWIARAAQGMGVPFLLVRSVVDRTSFRVPGLVGPLAGLPVCAQWLGAGLLSLLTPWNIPSLLHLKRSSAQAADSLARFLQAFLSARQICLAPASGAGGVEE